MSKKEKKLQESFKNSKVMTFLKVRGIEHLNLSVKDLETSLGF